MIRIRPFVRRLALHYVLGSSAAVLVAGGAIVFSSLRLPAAEAVRLAEILIVSLLAMLLAELPFFWRDLRPIFRLNGAEAVGYDGLRAAFRHTHRLPVLAVRRILIPHYLGLAVPAVLLTVLSIRQDQLNIPYSYIGLAGLGAFLVAFMHALIEFYWTAQAIRPLLLAIRKLSLERHAADPSLDGQIIVSVRMKLLLSTFLVGVLPLLLFTLAGQIRLYSFSNDPVGYWSWTTVTLLLGILFSSYMAWLLSREIKQPIDSLQTLMASVEEGQFDVRSAELYNDDFSRLVTGFNRMVSGLKVRDRMNSQLVQSYISTLAATLDARDRYTAGHSERVAAYAVEIGWMAGLSLQELDVVKKSALLHDIGKIGVRDAVLLKEGRLTDEEFDAVKQHPVLGEHILKRIEPAEAMADLLPGVRSHHEQYDGRGYPDGLAGESIPLLGRIIAIADAFDAMTSDRPYRKGMHVDKALFILEDGAGEQWDPKLTKLFVESMRSRQAKTADGVLDTRQPYSSEEYPGSSGGTNTG